MIRILKDAALNYNWQKAQFKPGKIKQGQICQQWLLFVNTATLDTIFYTNTVTKLKYFVQITLTETHE